MKKILFTTFVMFAFVITTNAHEFTKCSLDAGVELNANYLFRGNVLGGLSVQPWVEFTSCGFTLGAWGSYGSGTYDDFMNNSTNKELDLYLSYTTPGDYVTLKVTHFYYFDGSQFFNYSYDTKKLGSSQTELMAEIKPSSEYPFILSINTQVGGGDYCTAYGNNECFNADSTEATKLWSTYISLRYELEIDNWYIEPEIGFSPHKSFYTHSDRNWAINNISCKVNYNFFTNDYVNMYALAHVHFNLFDIGCEKENGEKENIEYTKNFGWNVGLGFTF